jgi:hypothetical protein
MSSPGNPMSRIMSIDLLTGAHYPQWREKINRGLALFEIDKAIMDKRPVELTLLEIPDDLSADAKAEREENSKLMSCYEIEKINWERSNRKWLMVIKEKISESIRGAIPNCATAVEYLEKLESQFTGSSKAYVSTLVKRLISVKYSDGGVRDHILSLTNVAATLKPLDLAIEYGFLIYLIFNSLSKEFETFEMNYNSMNEKWTLEKFMAMCVQEERGSSATTSVLIVLAWLSTTKRRILLRSLMLPRKKTRGKLWAWAPRPRLTKINASGVKGGATIRRIALSCLKHLNREG